MLRTASDSASPQIALRISSLRSSPPALVFGVAIAFGQRPTGSTEEVRFELTRPLRAYRFSRPAHSAALPLLRSESTGTIADAGKSVKIAVFSAAFVRPVSVFETSVRRDVSQIAAASIPIPRVPNSVGRRGTR